MQIPERLDYTLFPLYWVCRILAIKDLEERRKVLAAAPDGMRDAVKSFVEMEYARQKNKKRQGFSK